MLSFISSSTMLESRLSLSYFLWKLSLKVSFVGGGAGLVCLTGVVDVGFLGVARCVAALHLFNIRLSVDSHSVAEWGVWGGDNFYTVHRISQLIDKAFTVCHPTEADGAQSSQVPVPLPEDPYEAIRQAYLDGSNTEFDPFEDPIDTEIPELPLTIAPTII
ncbi:hypothetical protein Tco_1300361 [Tanacetum coccineum]